MGHKGVSKRKPKKDKSNVGVGISSDVRMGDNPPVQSLVKDKDAPLNKGSANNPSTGSNKKSKKDKR